MRVLIALKMNANKLGAIEFYIARLAAALERERKLIAGVDPDDLEAFLRVIRIMRRNVDDL